MALRTVYLYEHSILIYQLCSSISFCIMCLGKLFVLYVWVEEGFGTVVSLSICYILERKTVPTYLLTTFCKVHFEN